MGDVAGTIPQGPARRFDIVLTSLAVAESTLERYRLLSRRPALRLELRRGWGPPLLMAVAALLWLGVWFGAGAQPLLVVLASCGVVAALAVLLARERWTIGARGVRYTSALWRRPVEKPREAFERVSLRCLVPNGDPVELPWQVALEDGDGGGIFVFTFQDELYARVLGALAVEALELERVEGGDGGPEIAAAVSDALARL